LTPARETGFGGLGVLDAGPPRETGFGDLGVHSSARSGWGAASGDRVPPTPDSRESR
jgi:hypothetical protein